MPDTISTVKFSTIHRSTGAVKPYPNHIRIFVALHCLSLAMYAIFGKAFAYLGAEPVFVGEFLLLYALVVLLSTRPLAALTTGIGLPMAVFLVWQAGRTAPFLREYGIDAMRDAALWGYGLFAFAVASLLARYPTVLPLVIGRYVRFANYFVILGPLAWIVTYFFNDFLPVWPGTDVTIPLVKSGDICVNLAGIIAFILVGLPETRGWWLLPASCGATAAMMMNRGGMLAVIASALVSAILGQKPRRVILAILVLCCTGGLASVMDVQVRVPILQREISTTQIASSIQSLVSETGDHNLDGSKRWRQLWWQTIVGYTWDGPYYWGGKGYGVNLAIDDGFGGGKLRSPHNSHLNFLARSGVPGLALWVLLQVIWASQMLMSYFRAKRCNHRRWAAVFAWFIAYSCAFVINAAFDVSFEGPTAGILFWTIFGLGWGAHLIYRRENANRYGSTSTQWRQRYGSMYC